MQARELVKEIAEKPDQDQITINVGSLKGLIKLMRDYAIITHATNPEAEAAAAVESLIEYVDFNESTSVVRTEATTYRTTQLAEIFGVSVTAINNWIKKVDLSVISGSRTRAFDFELLTSEQESDSSRWRFYQARLEELS